MMNTKPSTRNRLNKIDAHLKTAHKELMKAYRLTEGRIDLSNVCNSTLEAMSNTEEALDEMWDTN